MEAQDVVVEQHSQVVQGGNAAGIVVHVGAQAVVIGLEVVGARTQVGDLLVQGGEGGRVTGGRAQVVDLSFQAGEVVLADRVGLQVGDAHTQGGQVGGQLLHSVLKGRQLSATESGRGAGAGGDRTLRDLVKQAGHDYGGLVAGQVLGATEGTVRVTENDALRHDLVDGVFGPVPGGHVCEGGHLCSRCRLGRRKSEGQRSRENDQRLLHKLTPKGSVRGETYQA